jgi:hypothetical protein
MRYMATTNLGRVNVPVWSLSDSSHIRDSVSVGSRDFEKISMACVPAKCHFNE